MSINHKGYIKISMIRSQKKSFKNFANKLLKMLQMDKLIRLFKKDKVN